MHTYIYICISHSSSFSPILSRASYLLRSRAVCGWFLILFSFPTLSTSFLFSLASLLKDFQKLAEMAAQPAKKKLLRHSRIILMKVRSTYTNDSIIEFAKTNRSCIFMYFYCPFKELKKIRKWRRRCFDSSWQRNMAGLCIHKKTVILDGSKEFESMCAHFTNLLFILGKVTEVKDGWLAGWLSWPGLVSPWLSSSNVFK